MLSKHVLCCLCSFLIVVQSATAQEKKPNIIFILVDDMGYADLGCMGSKEIRTPNIDRIAKEGVKLSNFYANALGRSDRQQKAVRHGKWKYLKDASTEFLFDLEADIGERKNLAYQHPDLVARLRQLHADWEREMDRSAPDLVVK